MAVDMTDETTAEYRQRISKMSVEDLEKSIKYLEESGYNCEGFVTADGVIVPRNKLLREVLEEKNSRRKK